VVSKKTAFIFPGQGSQAVGMAKDIYQSSPAAKALLDQVDAVLGRPLLQIMFEGPDEALKETYNTQPALYAASLAFYAAMGQQPDYVAGHSLGEYCALQAAGVFSFADGLKLVQARASAMTEAAKASPGGMAAVLKLSDADVEAVCAEAGIQAANYNCPGQLVVSGSADGIAKALELVKAKGGRAIPLAVSGAFHSHAMRPAGEALKVAFASVAWHEPKLPVIANVDAKPVASAAEAQSRLVEQLSGSVRWTQSVQALRALGVERFVEVGPGKVLAGLVKKIDEAAETANVNDAASLAALKG
jgi:[acyl-carrier-protein] S-malonyltransferase